MKNYKCAFSGALMGKQYSCQNALEVTRREGPSIACTEENMQQKCTELLDHLKAAALPCFGYEDDLSQMPHSVMMKIQTGGLTGLQNHLQGTPGVLVVENVENLVVTAEQRYGDFNRIPYADFVQEIVDFKLRRRR